MPIIARSALAILLALAWLPAIAQQQINPATQIRGVSGAPSGTGSLVLTNAPTIANLTATGTTNAANIIGTGTTSLGRTNIHGLAGADGLDLQVDTGASTLSSRLFFSNSTAGQSVVLRNSGGDFIVGTGGTPGGVSSGTTRLTITAAGAASIPGTLGVTGQATFSSLVWATGSIQSAAAAATGATVLGGNTSSNFRVLNKGGTNDYSQTSFVYSVNDTYVPATIAYKVTDGAGTTKGDLIFATRDVTTDTQPTERMRISSAGAVTVPSTLSVGSLLDDGGNLLISSTNPTVQGTTCGTSPTLTANNTHAFKLVIGTGGTANACQINFPSAPNGWTCFVNNISQVAVSDLIQSASTSTAVLIKQYAHGTSTQQFFGVADVWHFMCAPF